MSKMKRSEFLKDTIPEGCLTPSGIADLLVKAGVLEPDSPEKVERLEGFVYEYPSGLFSFNKTGESSLDKRVISKRKVREVLPGDPDPDEKVFTEAQVRRIIRASTFDYTSVQSWLRSFGLEE